MRNKGYAVLSSLKTVILSLATLFAGERGVQNDDSGPGNGESPTLSRTVTWLGGRDVTLHWKLPSPAP